MIDSGTERFNALRDTLRRRQCFKLVCGAGNEDREEVRKLSIVFTIAGATMLDLSANFEIIEYAKRGVNKAIEIAPVIGRGVLKRPYLNVSIGVKGDPHVRKAEIDKKKCPKCGACLIECPQKAISKDFVIMTYKCLGCGRCGTACPSGAVRYNNSRADISSILPECVKLGVETLELHAVADDDELFMNDWKLLNRIIKNNFISLCIDRSLLSNKRLIERVKAAYEITGDRMIVQADGVPMSGEKDDYNCTLQAVACADIVQKSKIPVMILLSGGTNNKTGLLAKQCGLTTHGVAIGSFARKLVRELINKEGFDDDLSLIKKSVEAAENLMRVNIEAISGRS